MPEECTNSPDLRDDAAVVQVLATTTPAGKWSAETFELLGDAVALARRWNGQVGAWALTPDVESPALDELAEHGCQNVRQLTNARFADWSAEAVSAALAREVPTGCRVILLPGTARGEEVAALLSELLEASWIADALTLATTRTGDLQISATLPGGKLSRDHRPAGDRPVVVTMRPGVAEARKVDAFTPPRVQRKEAALTSVPELTAVEEHLPADPRTVDLVFARRVVSAGRGAGGPEGVRLVADLADSLGASLGASRLVVDLGWAPWERQIGQTGRTVSPDLYVACGISGASHHLAGMRGSKHIVAINPDKTAPIHGVAHLSLPGDLQQVIPAILAAVQRRRTGSNGDA